MKSTLLKLTHESYFKRLLLPPVLFLSHPDDDDDDPGSSFSTLHLPLPPPSRRAELSPESAPKRLPVQSVEGSLSVSTPHSRKTIIHFPLQHQDIEDLPASGPSSVSSRTHHRHQPSCAADQVPSSKHRNSVTISIGAHEWSPASNLLSGVTHADSCSSGPSLARSWT
ncbi:hypothetical protein CEXT_534181 [Caerostris extrusa]|uniref:Uncharacterized protein n=1 Tax=Caerostris extrusa TaxID=172846 RepID=A0AAV4QNL0_CAEEX|nr:hypothetical protein CEXT_534181 [Caerostris extrusa]